LNVPQLGWCFDCAGSRAADHLDGLSRAPAEFDEEPRSDKTGTPQPALAMHKYVEAVSQACSQTLADLSPLLFEAAAGYRHVSNWKVVPVHVCTADLLRELPDVQRRHLMIFDQSDNCGRAPGSDRFDVCAEIPLPRASKGIWLVLTRAKGDPDASAFRSSLHGRNLQWVSFAGPDGGTFPALLRWRVSPALSRVALDRTAEPQIYLT
jgi:hypothetical protein